LDAFSFKTRENDEHKRIVKPMKKHYIVQKNSSKILSSGKKGDNL
jgi:hypothetical protein